MLYHSKFIALIKLVYFFEISLFHMSWLKDQKNRKGGIKNQGLAKISSQIALFFSWPLGPLFRTCDGAFTHSVLSVK